MPIKSHSIKRPSFLKKIIFDTKYREDTTKKFKGACDGYRKEGSKYIHSESSLSPAQNFSRNLRISEERSIRTRSEELQLCNVLNLVMIIIKHV